MQFLTELRNIQKKKQIFIHQQKCRNTNRSMKMNKEGSINVKYTLISVLMSESIEI